MMSLLVWLPGPMFLPGGLYPWSHVPSGEWSLSGGGSLSIGVSVRRGSLLGGVSVRRGSLSGGWSLSGGRSLSGQESLSGETSHMVLHCSLAFLSYRTSQKKCQRILIYYLDILEYTLPLNGSPYYNDRC